MSKIALSVIVYGPFLSKTTIKTNKKQMISSADTFFWMTRYLLLKIEILRSMCLPFCSLSHFPSFIDAYPWGIFLPTEVNHVIIMKKRLWTCFWGHKANLFIYCKFLRLRNLWQKMVKFSQYLIFKAPQTFRKLTWNLTF